MHFGVLPRVWRIFPGNVPRFFTSRIGTNLPRFLTSFLAGISRAFWYLIHSKKNDSSLNFSVRQLSSHTQYREYFNTVYRTFSGVSFYIYYLRYIRYVLSCLYVWIYVYVCVCVWTVPRSTISSRQSGYVRMCMYACIHIYTCITKGALISRWRQLGCICMCVYVYIHTHGRVGMCIYVYIREYTYAHIHKRCSDTKIEKP